jgi:hypothetical protein
MSKIKYKTVIIEARIIDGTDIEVQGKYAKKIKKNGFLAEDGNKVILDVVAKNKGAEIFLQIIRDNNNYLVEDRNKKVMARLDVLKNIRKASFFKRLHYLFTGKIRGIC